MYALCLLVATAQLVNIQVVNADEYADRGVRQRERVIELPATRGRIYDRHGDVLATSVASATVYADPGRFREIEAADTRSQGEYSALEAAHLLAPVLETDASQILERLQRDGRFAYLQRQVDWELGERIAALGIDGVGVFEEPRRQYPAGGLAGQVVGFTGIDGQGLQGLEAQYDSVLRGSAGTLMLERAPSGLEIASGLRDMTPARPGTDLVLTLDRDIQHAAERAVAGAVEETGARGAGVVVLDARSFEVLAMSSAPGFDPNERRENDHASWRNRAVTDVFEPGSAQKALTVAAAIEEGIVSPSTRFSVPDRISVADSVFSDIAEHPTMDMSVSEIIERSSNVGTILIARELGADNLDAYLRSFGYGTPTGVGFPGESPGLLMPREQWWGTSLPTIAIGQGVAVTLTQLATAYATIANDGVAHAPRIVRGTVGDDGQLAPTPADQGGRVVSPETADAVRGMLLQAVEGPTATGGLARVPGYSVAGKTGTARKPNEGSVGYSDGYVATFVGFAPVDDPQIVVAVMVDEPTPIYGGVVAAPLFREVAEVALSVRRVPPDRSDDSLDDLLGMARRDALEAARREGPAVSVDDATAMLDGAGDPADGPGTG